MATDEWSAEDWVVKVHLRERVLEVSYPLRPAPDAVDRYTAAVKAAVVELGSEPFNALVDQRAAPVLSAEVSLRMSNLLAWVHEQGLKRVVRVVRRSAIAELQARRIVRDAGYDDEHQELFHSRDEAWVALTTGR